MNRVWARHMSQAHVYIMWHSLIHTSATASISIIIIMILYQSTQYKIIDSISSLYIYLCSTNMRENVHLILGCSSIMVALMCDTDMWEPFPCAFPEGIVFQCSQAQTYDTDVVLVTWAGWPGPNGWICEMYKMVPQTAWEGDTVSWGRLVMLEVLWQIKSHVWECVDVLGFLSLSEWPVFAVFCQCFWN